LEEGLKKGTDSEKKYLLPFFENYLLAFTNEIALNTRKGATKYS
jgi:hypothetical protein